MTALYLMLDWTLIPTMIVVIGGPILGLVIAIYLLVTAGEERRDG